jgi:glycosyltransferase involved in cell wall biosynthesis
VPSDFGLLAAIAVSFFFAAFFVKSRLNYLGIPKLSARPRSSGAPAAHPDCMVIVPARNEEANIARVVKSFPHDTVIVVDDHSEDGTAEAARQAGAGVLPAPDLLGQAIGKSSACAAGARVLTSRWILFTDADTWFDPGFLDAAVACAEASGLSFLSFYLQSDLPTFAAQTLVPCAEALYFSGVNPRANAGSAFNGQCVLARREAYEFVGGHKAVSSSMIEDVKLAALAARHRMKFALARTSMGHVRYHADGLWRGFERNAFRFVMIGPWAGLNIVLAACVAALWLPALVLLLISKLWAPAVVFALLPWALLGVWYRNPLRALLAPLGIYGMFFVILNGFVAAVTGRDIVWKGRAL